MIQFELQGDEGDEDRVKLNLIQLAREQGTLERIETKEEIRFKGMIVLPDKASPSGENHIVKKDDTPKVQEKKA